MATNAPEICPQCGAEVPPRALACPECGSCEETGWSDNATASRLDLPDDSFDYQDYVQREFAPSPRKPRGVSRFWWLVAVALAGGCVLFFLWPLVRTLTSDR